MLCVVSVLRDSQQILVHIIHIIPRLRNSCHVYENNNIHKVLKSFFSACF